MSSPSGTAWAMRFRNAVELDAAVAPAALDEEFIAEATDLSRRPRSRVRPPHLWHSHLRPARRVHVAGNAHKHRAAYRVRPSPRTPTTAPSGPGSASRRPCSVPRRRLPVHFRPIAALPQLGIARRPPKTTPAPGNAITAGLDGLTETARER